MPEFDDSIGEQWHQDFQGFMHQSRENGQSGLDDEFGAQQEIYTKVCCNCLHDLTVKSYQISKL